MNVMELFGLDGKVATVGGEVPSPFSPRLGDLEG